MTNIVERLRQGAGHEPADVMAAERTMDEAADVIERLLAALQMIHDDTRDDWVKNVARRALEPKP